MHTINLHLVLYAFEETLMWWELNFNTLKPNRPLHHIRVQNKITAWWMDSRTLSSATDREVDLFNGELGCFVSLKKIGCIVPLFLFSTRWSIKLKHGTSARLKKTAMVENKVLRTRHRRDAQLSTIYGRLQRRLEIRSIDVAVIFRWPQYHRTCTISYLVCYIASCPDVALSNQCRLLAAEATNKREFFIMFGKITSIHSATSNGSKNKKNLLKRI
jgi:hypothetical protein